MSGEIWVPVSETKTTVRDGEVKAWDEMRFVPRPVRALHGTGFAAETVDHTAATDPPAAGVVDPLDRP